MATVAGFAAWGTVLEPHWIQPVTYMLSIRGLPDPFDGFTILHLSDLHGRVGVFASRKFVEWAASADMIALTGDLYSPLLSRQVVARALQLWAGRMPLYYCSGNHDYQAGQLRHSPWDPGDSLLDNRAIRLRRKDAVMWLAGLPDLVKGRPRLGNVLQEMDSEEVAILLCHRPDGVLLEGIERFALVLSGHTHGGQVVVPGIGAPFKHNHVGPGYVAGRRELTNGTVLITSRGLGTSELPVRFACRPELVRVILQSWKK